MLGCNPVPLETPGLYLGGDMAALATASRHVTSWGRSTLRCREFP
jgi:hypothetical protein